MEKVKVTTWEEYRAAAMRTCTAESNNIEYMQLGLVGEAGEVANKVKKIIRDDHGMLTAERNRQILAELGDVMWYVAGVSTVTDVVPEICRQLPTFTELQQYMDEPVNCIRVDGMTFTEATLELAQYVSRVVDVLSDEAMDERLAHVIEAVAALGGMIGYNVQQVCQGNVDKLTERFNANTIHGSGDGIIR